MNSPVTPDRVADLIRAGLPGATVRVESGDNTHFAARVVAAEFAGKRPLARHPLLSMTLGARVGRELHALSLEALTPDEAASSGKS